MKNIFKKNQVIITALAIMIAVAGYLNFTGDKVDTKNIGVDGYVAADTQTAGIDTDSLASSADIATGDNTLATTDNDEYVSEDVTVNADLTQADATDVDVTTADATVADIDASDADVADISDEDLTAENDASIAVTDTGELQTQTEDTTGEAVLVNTTINNSFFSSSKLKREQTRSKNNEILKGLIDDKNISEDQKKDAINSVINMTSIAEKENITETLLEAKGFSSVVSILDETVEVIVNATNLTEQDMAVIEDTVKRKTGISIEYITITPVEVE